MFDWLMPFFYILSATEVAEAPSGFSIEQVLQPPLLYACIGGLILFLFLLFLLLRFLRKRRLKVGIKDYDLVKESCIREAGFPGLIRPRKDEVQIIVGEDADELKNRLGQELSLS